MRKKKGKKRFCKSLIIDIRDSIVFELILNILLFIPRILISAVKHLF